MAAKKKSYPSYQKMITVALTELPAYSGQSISRIKIKNYILQNYSVLETNLKRYLSNALNRLTEDGYLVKVKMSYRLSPKAKQQNKKKAPAKKGARKTAPKKKAVRAQYVYVVTGLLPTMQLEPFGVYSTEIKALNAVADLISDDKTPGLTKAKATAIIKTLEATKKSKKAADRNVNLEKLLKQGFQILKVKVNGDPIVYN